MSPDRKIAVPRLANSQYHCCGGRAMGSCQPRPIALRICFQHDCLSAVQTSKRRCLRPVPTANIGGNNPRSSAQVTHRCGTARLVNSSGSGTCLFGLHRGHTEEVGEKQAREIVRCLRFAGFFDSNDATASMNRGRLIWYIAPRAPSN